METDIEAVAAKARVDVQQWRDWLEDLTARVGARFGRAEPRRRAGQFLAGMIAGLPRVNCAAIAEHAGEPDPR